MKPTVPDAARATAPDPIIAWLRESGPAADVLPAEAAGPWLRESRTAVRADLRASFPALAGAAEWPAAGAGPRCAGCGEPILEDQTIVRLNAGVAREGSFSHLLMRPDVFLHAGEADASGQAVGERWCVTEQGVARGIALLRLHGLTGASTR